MGYDRGVRLITAQQVCSRLAYSRTGLWRIRTEKGSTFPTPIHLGVSLRWDEAEVEVCDLLAVGAIADLHARLRVRSRHVDGLVNNAGMGRHGNFVEQELERLLAMMRLNMFALVEFTHQFVGGMARRGQGHVLNIASTAGRNPVPSHAIYGATKAFIVSMSEAVSLGIRPAGVRITCPMPGPVWTEFFDVSGQKPTLYNRLSSLSSPAVARDCFKAMVRGRNSAVVGWANWASMLIAKLLPGRVMA